MEVGVIYEVIFLDHIDHVIKKEIFRYPWSFAVNRKFFATRPVGKKRWTWNRRNLGDNTIDTINAIRVLAYGEGKEIKV